MSVTPRVCPVCHCRTFLGPVCWCCGAAFDANHHDPLPLAIAERPARLLPRDADDDGAPILPRECNDNAR